MEKAALPGVEGTKLGFEGEISSSVGSEGSQHLASSLFTLGGPLRSICWLDIQAITASWRRWGPATDSKAMWVGGGGIEGVMVQVNRDNELAIGRRNQSSQE